MSRGGLKIERTSDENVDFCGGSCPDWLSRFADKFSKEEKEKKTAVEVMRERSGPSIFEQMSSIIGGGYNSPYGSVEEAVTDYQKRTGLAEYQRQALAQEIITAAEEESEKPEDTEKKTPELLKKHPKIEHFIDNIISTQKGIQIPAVLQSIVETFKRDGINESDVDDADLARYINRKLPARDNNDAGEQNLGLGVGTERNVFYDSNDENKNPFSALMPAKQY